MDNSALKKAIEAKIAGAGKVLIVHAGTYIEAGGRSECGLALVERERNYINEHSIFIFYSETSELQLNDLTCDQVLPVDKDFICEFGQSDNSGDVGVQLTDSGGVTVKLELPSNSQTDSFIDEIYRVVESSRSRGNSSSTWTPQPGILTPSNSMAVGQTMIQKLDTTDERVSINLSGISTAAIREKKVQRLMDRKSVEYTYSDNIKVLAATWNVNGKGASVSLVNWLTVDPDPPDIYAVGFQELDLSKEAFLFVDTPREDEWRRAVENALATRREPYKMICLVRLVGMMLIVYVREKHYNSIKNVASCTVGTGIMNKMGNKGGVGVRFDFHSTSMCFVNSHLAAHVEEFERRNQDYNSITNRMVFTSPFMGDHRKTIKDHDQIYWLGDLNYRVTLLPVMTVKAKLKDGNLDTVLTCDQLTLQKRDKKVFDGYTEGRITFQPTYKYDTDTDTWDSSEKARAPAWCDRILWKGNGIKQLSYRSHPTLRISDHKPVTSLFESQIRIIDEAKQRKVYEQVLKLLDRLENEVMPQVMVDTNEILFETVRYYEPISQELIIANTGQVPAQFLFINKLDDDSFCKPWLNIEPHEGIILPGEKCDVKIEVFVDKRSASKLNSGEDKLYDILVLHLEGGKDIFITVTGTYERSCFGSSIEALVHVSVPIREIPIGKLVQLETGNMGSGPEPYPVPKEIWFLVDHLYRHGLKKRLFLQEGLNSEIIQIRNWLDNGSSDPLPGSVYSIAEALLLLLESTAEAVIPFNLHPVCMNSPSYLQCKQIVQGLPLHRRNVFLYLCVFLKELLDHTADNGLDTKTIATVFGGIFLRDPPGRQGRNEQKSKQAELDRRKADFVYHFITNDQTDFILGR